MQKSILFIAREFTDGGAAYLALRHMQHAADSHRIVMLVTGPIDAAVVARLPSSVTLTQLELPAHMLGAGLQAAREAIAKLPPAALDTNYDAVIGSSLFPDMVACAVFGLSRSPRKLLVLLDEGPLVPNLPPSLVAAMQSAMAAADHLVPVSRGLLERLAAEFPVLESIPATVIPPPIDPTHADIPSPFPGEPSSSLPRVVTAARLVRDKGINVALEVHYALRSSGCDFHWHIVGEGPDRVALEAEISRRAMGDRFHLEGFREDARAFMRHADLFVLYSRSEGCPTVVREALAEGTPVLCSEVNGARELIDDGVTGIVIEYSTQALQTQLRTLLESPVALARLRASVAAQPLVPDGDDTRRLLRLLEHGATARPAPLVSILIPTYNHAEVVSIAIRSALMQDFRSLEVVVLDDASTDATGTVAERWHFDARFHYRRNARNLGRVANYRQGLEHAARGEWVLMLDGDDYLTDPTFISAAVAALGAHSSARPLFVQAGHRVLHRQSGAEPDWASPHADILPEIDEEVRLMRGVDYLQFVYATGFFTHLGTLYSRAAALASGFYTRDISSSDMDSLLRLALTGDILVLRKIAGCWVQHGGNASHNLPLGNIRENVRLFRDIARVGAGRGMLDMNRIETALTRYEAHTLAHLFKSTIGKSALGIMDGLSMIRIAFGVNPRVFRDPHLQRIGLRTLRSLLGLTLRRLASRLRASFGDV